MDRRGFMAGAISFVAVVASCGGSDEESDGVSGDGVRLVPVGGAADLLGRRDDDGRVILDVRTPEEFAEGHLEDAELLDFYRADFADQIAELDRDTPYLIYCRSGNRSGQARAIMQELGFTDVADLDGGVIAWEADGRDFVVP